MPCAISGDIKFLDQSATIQSAMRDLTSKADDMAAKLGIAHQELINKSYGLTMPDKDELPTFYFDSSDLDIPAFVDNFHDVTNDATFPDAPPTYYADPVVTQSFPGAPGYDISLYIPNFDFQPPDYGALTVPSSPAVPAVAIPGAPSISLPDVPSLANVQVPDIPTVSFPSFSGVLADGPVAPSPGFAYYESAYTSDLLVTLQGLLIDWLSGVSTGLSPAVEQAIWNRARDRENGMLDSTLTAVYDDFAARGYILPPGAAASLTQQAIQNAGDKTATLSREIMIKQAELEQSNRHFAIQTGKDLNSVLMQYQSEVYARSLDAMKFTASLAVQIFNAQVQQYNANVEAFKAKASVYATQIQAEVTKLEAYKLRIEGQKLVVSMNAEMVNVYRARVEAAKAMVETYAAEVNAARVQAEVARLQIDIFKGQVEAFGETVRARATDVEAYAARVRAEATKIEVNKSLVDTYKAKVDAYAAETKAKVDIDAANVKRAELTVDVYKAESEAYKAQVQGIAAQVSATADVQKAQASIIESKARAVASHASAIADVGRVKLDSAKEDARISSEIFDARVKLLIEKTHALFESAKMQAASYAQLSAGMMASYSIGAHINSSSASSQGQTMTMSENCNYSENISKQG